MTTQAINVPSYVFVLVKKMFTSLHDIEKTIGAQAFKTIVDEKISVFCKPFLWCLQIVFLSVILQFAPTSQKLIFVQM
jgi:hypothetical protein